MTPAEVPATHAKWYEKGYSLGYIDGILAAMRSLKASDVEHGTITAADSFFEEHIHTLELTARTRNPLLRQRIYKVCDAYEFHHNYGLGSIYMFGPNCFKELNEKLAQAGYPSLGSFR